VQRLDAMGIGLAGKTLGGGRQKKGEAIDLAVGVNLLKKEGDAVKPGDILAVLLANDQERAEEAATQVLGAYTVGPQALPLQPLIKRVLSPPAQVWALP
jgi:thymidine phosphorylase